MASRYYYQTEISHKGLNKYRIVKAASQYELSQKVTAIEAQWNEQWAKKVERDNKQKSTEEALIYANELSKQAENVQKALETILINSLHPECLDLDDLKDHSEFVENCPKRPLLEKLPVEPRLSDIKYNPKPPLLIKISKKRMADFTSKNLAQYNIDLDEYKTRKADIEAKNGSILFDFNDSLAQWEQKRDSFLLKQSEANKKIDCFYEDYINGETEAVEQYYTLLLEKIELPINYNKTITTEYNSKNRTLIVDILLPSIEEVPNLKSVSYIKSKSEFKEFYYSEQYLKKLYDDIIYQIVLQSLNYLFTVGAEFHFFDSIVLNGKIKAIDRSTGKSIEPYVLSVNTTRAAFSDINLTEVNPKIWFKSAKGISATALANITPIAPIVAMEREDHRFVDGYAVADNIDNSVNLAAIDWQDFENLIREVFEKEFNVNGGEVKITQASRDGGVDAIAFDPDPIRGGKIVIQAKRYTNIVGVSAVRDLYGTVMNEGATKGILVTTSNYGNDAYNFAQGKPITLMNGANLLYLMEKHGYKAHIDIKAAKEMLNSNKYY